jgi:hypothetical protein
MNKDEKDENKKAVGTFRYIPKESLIVNNIIGYRPKILLSEKADIFTLLHELGHYFLYKRDEPQSEYAADLFIEEFICEYLPPFFKWIYQIDIKIRSKKELNFSCVEYYTYLKEYEKWIENKKFF